MSGLDDLPGMKSGETIRNLVVAFVYFLFLPLLIIAFPLIAAVAVTKNTAGVADKLQGVPGIEAGGSLQGGIVAFVGAIVLLAVLGAFMPAEDPQAGGASGPSSDAADSTPTPTQAAADSPAPTETQAPEPTATEPTPTEAPEETLQVRVIYSQEWSGAISYTNDGSSTSRSVDGSGTTRFDIPAGAEVVSANAQKQDDSGQELTVQIIDESGVVAESSTTAEFGVAQVSESFF